MQAPAMNQNTDAERPLYLFLSDETNTTPTDSAQFLIFGAAVVPMAQAAEVVRGVQQIRLEAGYPAKAEFKFDTRSRPPNVSKPAFDAAKSNVLDLAFKCGVRFMACMVHHGIAARIDAKNRPLWSLKTLLCEFDLFLSREKTTGICAVDRFDTAHAILSMILAGGVDPSGDLGKFQRDLSNIWMYSVTSISCSHLCSICDIVLGAFRYCVNSTPPADVARKIYPQVRRLFMHAPRDPRTIEGWGLFLRPKNLKAKIYVDAYDRVRAHLLDLEGSSPTQQSATPSPV